MKYLVNYTLLILLMVSTKAYTQRRHANTYTIAGWWGPASPPFSPVVNSDRSITFRVNAKQASSVKLLFGEWFIKPVDLVKDTAGIWRITIPPVQPGIYSYLFNVDGLPTLDMMIRW